MEKDGWNGKQSNGISRLFSSLTYFFKTEQVIRQGSHLLLSSGYYLPRLSNGRFHTDDGQIDLRLFLTHTKINWMISQEKCF